MKANTIVIADDHAVVRQGLRALFAQANFEVVGEAENGERAYQVWLAEQPSLILLDLDMPGIGGLETVHRILNRDPQAKILIFSMHDDSVYATRSMKAGAKGYVVKTDAPEHLIDAAKTIVKGGHYISVELAQNMAMEQFSCSDNPLDILSPREFEVFRRLAQGESLTHISESLHIGYKTTANIQTQVRQKLGVETTAQLVHMAINLGIVQK